MVSSAATTDFGAQGFAVSFDGAKLAKDTFWGSTQAELLCMIPSRWLLTVHVVLDWSWRIRQASGAGFHGSPGPLILI